MFDSTFDVARARSETPGCEDIIHFNNAGSSLPPKPVTDAVLRYLVAESRMGGYEAEAAFAAEISAYRVSLARLLNAESGEVAFAGNDSLAFSTAFWGLVHPGTIAHGSMLLVDRSVYVSHYLALLQARKYFGMRIEIAEHDASGTLDLDSLRTQVRRSRPSAVVLTTIGLQRGLVNPSVEAGRIIRQNSDALYLLDACQSIGQLPVDVRLIDCDVMTGTGRKFLRGPRGTGLLYVRQDLIGNVDPPAIDGHSATWDSTHTYEMLPDARRFETYEVSYATKVGLGIAAEYALSWGIDAIARRVAILADRLRTRLAEAGYQVLDGGVARSGIVTFGSANESAADVKARLGAVGVNISAPAVKSARLDLEQRGLADVARASVHYYNTTDEIETFIERLGPPR